MCKYTNKSILRPFAILYFIFDGICIAHVFCIDVHNIMRWRIHEHIRKTSAPYYSMRSLLFRAAFFFVSLYSWLLFTWRKKETENANNVLEWSYHIYITLQCDYSVCLRMSVCYVYPTNQATAIECVDLHNRVKTHFTVPFRSKALYWKNPMHCYWFH